MHLAAFKGDLKAIESLLLSGLFHAEDGTRRKFEMFKAAMFPLHIASHCGHLDVVRLLISHGVRVDARARNN